MPYDKKTGQFRAYSEDELKTLRPDWYPPSVSEIMQKALGSTAANVNNVFGVGPGAVGWPAPAADFKQLNNVFGMGKNAVGWPAQDAAPTPELDALNPRNRHPASFFPEAPAATPAFNPRRPMMGEVGPLSDVPSQADQMAAALNRVSSLSGNRTNPGLTIPKPTPTPAGQMSPLAQGFERINQFGDAIDHGVRQNLGFDYLDKITNGKDVPKLTEEYAKYVQASRYAGADPVKPQQYFENTGTKVSHMMQPADWHKIEIDAGTRPDKLSAGTRGFADTAGAVMGQGATMGAAGGVGNIASRLLLKVPGLRNAPAWIQKAVGSVTGAAATGGTYQSSMEGLQELAYPEQQTFGQHMKDIGSTAGYWAAYGAASPLAGKAMGAVGNKMGPIPHMLEKNLPATTEIGKAVLEGGLSGGLVGAGMFAGELLKSGDAKKAWGQLTNESKGEMQENFAESILYAFMKRGGKAPGVPHERDVLNEMFDHVYQNASPGLKEQFDNVIQYAKEQGYDDQTAQNVLMDYYGKSKDGEIAIGQASQHVFAKKFENDFLQKQAQGAVPADEANVANAHGVDPANPATDYLTQKEIDAMLQPTAEQLMQQNAAEERQRLQDAQAAFNGMPGQAAAAQRAIDPTGVLEGYNYGQNKAPEAGPVTRPAPVTGREQGPTQQFAQGDTVRIEGQPGVYQVASDLQGKKRKVIGHDGTEIEVAPQSLRKFDALQVGDQVQAQGRDGTFTISDLRDGKKIRVTDEAGNMLHFSLNEIAPAFAAPVAPAAQPEPAAAPTQAAQTVAPGAAPIAPAQTAEPTAAPTMDEPAIEQTPAPPSMIKQPVKGSGTAHNFKEETTKGGYHRFVVPVEGGRVVVTQFNQNGGASKHYQSYFQPDGTKEQKLGKVVEGKLGFDPHMMDAEELRQAFHGHDSTRNTENPEYDAWTGQHPAVIEQQKTREFAAYTGEFNPTHIYRGSDPVEVMTMRNGKPFIKYAAQEGKTHHSAATAKWEDLQLIENDSHDVAQAPVEAPAQPAEDGSVKAADDMDWIRQMEEAARQRLAERNGGAAAPTKPAEQPKAEPAAETTKDGSFTITKTKAKNGKYRYEIRHDDVAGRIELNPSDSNASYAASHFTPGDQMELRYIKHSLDEAVAWAKDYLAGIAIPKETPSEPAAPQPKADNTPKPGSEFTTFEKAETGKPVKAEMYQGRGATPEEIYGPEAVQEGRAVPIMGPGQYYADTKEDASIYGKDVKQHTVTLENPFVITSYGQWHTLMGKAGAQHLDSRGPLHYQESEKIPEATKKLQSYLTAQGHDGVVIRMGENDKGLHESFGHNQMVVFGAAEAKAEEKPAASSEARKYKAGDVIYRGWEGFEGKIVEVREKAYVVQFGKERSNIPFELAEAVDGASFSPTKEEAIARSKFLQQFPETNDRPAKWGDHVTWKSYDGTQRTGTVRGSDSSRVHVDVDGGGKAILPWSQISKVGENVNVDENAPATAATANVTIDKFVSINEVHDDGIYYVDELPKPADVYQNRTYAHGLGAYKGEKDVTTMLGKLEKINDGNIQLSTSDEMQPIGAAGVYVQGTVQGVFPHDAASIVRNGRRTINGRVVKKGFYNGTTDYERLQKLLAEEKFDNSNGIAYQWYAYIEAIMNPTKIEGMWYRENAMKPDELAKFIQYGKDHKLPVWEIADQKEHKKTLVHNPKATAKQPAADGNVNGNVNDKQLEKLFHSVSPNDDEIEAVRRAIESGAAKNILLSYGTWKPGIQPRGKDNQLTLREFVEKVKGKHTPTIIVDNGAYSGMDVGFWDVFDFFTNEWTMEPAAAWSLIAQMEQENYYYGGTEENNFADEVEIDQAQELRQQFPKFFDFRDWLHANDKVIDYVIAPDSMDKSLEPDARQEMANYAYRFFQAGNVKFIPVFQYGADTKYIDELVSEGADYLAIGGTIGKFNPDLKSDTARAAYVRSIVEKYPDVKFHLLGSQDQWLFDRVPGLYSADGTTWRSAATDKTPTKEQAIEQGITDDERQGIRVDNLTNEIVTRDQNATRASGNTATVKTESGREIQVRYEIRNAIDGLTASNDFHSFAINPAYPQELQPRDRSRAASAEQINRMANKLEPSFLGESPKASEGAPIVDENGVVESGNGRVMAIQLMYRLNNKSRYEYRDWLEQNLQKFGLTQRDIDSHGFPVLVRVRVTPLSPEERTAFVQESNVQAVAAMSAMEQARADAGKIKPGLISQFNPTDDGNIAAAQNRQFVRDFMQAVVPASERGRYIDADGALNQDGVRRITNAIFARVYGSSPALERLSESNDNNVRNITTGMLLSARNMLRLKAAIENGDAFDTLDLTGDITAAVNKLSELRDKGETVADFFNQGDLFGAQLSPEAKAILAMFEAAKHKVKQITDFLNIYAQAAMEAGSPNQGALFGDMPKPSKADMLQAAVNKLEGETGEQITLYQEQPASGQTNTADHAGQGNSTQTQENAADQPRPPQVRDDAFIDLFRDDFSGMDNRLTAEQVETLHKLQNGQIYAAPYAVYSISQFDAHSPILVQLIVRSPSPKGYTGVNRIIETNGTVENKVSDYETGMMQEIYENTKARRWIDAQQNAEESKVDPEDLKPEKRDPASIEITNGGRTFTVKKGDYVVWQEKQHPANGKFLLKVTGIRPVKREINGEIQNRSFNRDGIGVEVVAHTGIPVSQILPVDSYVTDNHKEGIRQHIENDMVRDKHLLRVAVKPFSNEGLVVIYNTNDGKMGTFPLHSDGSLGEPSRPVRSKRQPKGPDWKATGQNDRGGSGFDQNEYVTLWEIPDEMKGNRSSPNPAPAPQQPQEKTAQEKHDEWHNQPAFKHRLHETPKKWDIVYYNKDGAIHYGELSDFTDNYVSVEHTSGSHTQTDLLPGSIGQVWLVDPAYAPHVRDKIEAAFRYGSDESLAAWEENTTKDNKAWAKANPEELQKLWDQYKSSKSDGDVKAADDADWVTRMENAARQRIEDRKGRMMSGLPMDDLADYAVIGFAKIVRGVRDFKKFSDEMIDEFGPSIKIYMGAIYGQAMSMLDMSREDVMQVVQAAQKNAPQPEQKPQETQPPAPPKNDTPAPAPEPAPPSQPQEPATWREQPWGKDARKSHELAVSLDNLQTDEQQMPALADAVFEAKYVLNTFNEGGHANNDDLIGKNGADATKRARGEVKAIEAFIGKYESEADTNGNVDQSNNSGQHSGGTGSNRDGSSSRSGGQTSSSGTRGGRGNSAESGHSGRSDGRRDNEPGNDAGTSSVDNAAGGQRPADVVDQGQTSVSDGVSPGSAPARGTNDEPAGRNEELESGERVGIDVPNFVEYVPQRITGQDHPGEVVEPFGLSLVEYPQEAFTDPKYAPHEIVQKGTKEAKLSDMQLEVVSLAKYNFDNGKRGMLIADDTGIGKTAEQVAIAADAFHSGKAKRILIVTKNDQVADGFINENEKFGFGLPMTLVNSQSHRNFKDDHNLNLPKTQEKMGEMQPKERDAFRKRMAQNPYTPLDVKEGVIVMSPTTFRTATHAVNEWLRGAGSDVIVMLDESHVFKNVAGGASTALAARDLFRNFSDNGQFIYSSATAAEDIAGMEHLYGLRLWGVDGFNDFRARLQGVQSSLAGSKGSPFDRELPLVVMEQIIRELKGRGQYVGRSLSMDGIEMEGLPIELTQDELDEWGRASEFVLHVARSAEPFKKRAKQTAFVVGYMRRLRGFYVMKGAIRWMQANSKNGVPPRVALNGFFKNGEDEETGENAMLEAAINQIQGGAAADDVRNELLSMLHGQSGERPVPFLPSPVDMLTKAFGNKTVAVIDGDQTPAQRMDSVQKFQSGKARIIYFTQAGNTGINLHDLTNEKITFIPIDYPWEAKEQKQSEGRVNRTGQKTKPRYLYPFTPSSIDKKFVGTLKARYESMGALSRGKSINLGGDSFGNFDFSGPVAKQAVFNAVPQLTQEQIADMFGQEFAGLFPPAEDGSASEDSGVLDINRNVYAIFKNGDPVKKFLNALMLLDVETGNEVFDKFVESFQAVKEAMDMEGGVAGTFESYYGEQLASSKGEGNVTVRKIKTNLTADQRKAIQGNLKTARKNLNAAERAKQTARATAVDKIEEKITKDRTKQADLRPKYQEAKKAWENASNPKEVERLNKRKKKIGEDLGKVNERIMINEQLLVRLRAGGAKAEAAYQDVPAVKKAERAHEYATFKLMEAEAQADANDRVMMLDGQILTAGKMVPLKAAIRKAAKERYGGDETRIPQVALRIEIRGYMLKDGSRVVGVVVPAWAEKQVLEALKVKPVQGLTNDSPAPSGQRAMASGRKAKQARMIKRLKDTTRVLTPKTAHVIADILADGLDVVIYQGRVSPGAEGVYNQLRNQAIRVRARSGDNWRTVGHELAHAFVANGSIVGDSKELKALADGLYPNPLAIPKGLEEEEGFAEFFRLWVADPDLAEKYAPLTVAAFEQHIASDPVLEPLFAKIKLLVDEDFKDGPTARAARAIISSEWRGDRGDPDTQGPQYKLTKPERILFNLADFTIPAKHLDAALKDAAIKPELSLQKLMSIMGDSKSRALLTFTKVPQDSKGYHLKGPVLEDLYKNGIKDIIKFMGNGKINLAGKELREDKKARKSSDYSKVLYNRYKKMGAKDAFDALLLALRVNERYSATGAEDGKLPLTKAHAQEIIDEATQKYPDAIVSARELTTRFSDVVLELTTREDVITAKTAQNVKDGSDWYIPFYYVDGKTPASTGVDNTGRRNRNPIKRFFGQNKPVIDAYQAMLLKLMEVHQAIEYKRVLNLLHDMANTGEVKHFMSMLPPRLDVTEIASEQIADAIFRKTNIDLSQALQNIASFKFFSPNRNPDPNRHTIINIKNGKAREIELAKDLFESVMAMKPVQVQAFGKFLRNITKAQRFTGLVTLRYFFSTMFARDPGVVLLQSDKPFKVFRHYIDSFGAIFGTKDGKSLYDSFVHSGAALGAMENMLTNMGRNHFGDDILDLPAAGWGKVKKGAKMVWVRVVKSPSEAMRVLEETPRIAQYVATWKTEVEKLGHNGSDMHKLYLEHGTEALPQEVQDAMERILVDAAYAAREVTTNFGLHGANETVRKYIPTVPFLPGNIQGFYKFLRTCKQHPIRTPLLAASLGTLSALSHLLMLGLIGGGDDDEKRRRWHDYMNMDSTLKDKYWWYPVVDGIDIALGKPFEYAIPSNIIERVLEQQSGEPGARQWHTDMGKMLFSSLVNTDYVNNIVQVYQDIQANKTSLGGQIVPIGEQRLAKNLQSGADTSMTSKHVSDFLTDMFGIFGGPSPRQMDYAVKGILGRYGSGLLNVTDFAIELAYGGNAKSAFQAMKPIAGAAHLPIVGQILYDSSEMGGSRIINKFYSDLEKATGYSSSAVSMMKEHGTTKVALPGWVTESGLNLLRALPMLDEVANQMTDMNAMFKVGINDPKTSPKDREHFRLQQHFWRDTIAGIPYGRKPLPPDPKIGIAPAFVDEMYAYITNQIGLRLSGEASKPKGSTEQWQYYMWLKNGK